MFVMLGLHSISSLLLYWGLVGWTVVLLCVDPVITADPLPASGAESFLSPSTVS